ncbi:hypothetical protein NP493_1304g00075 [Ridgeia piscesae]|uniref:Uncharacterized protein n=1 Tax=Ridgeia piscesae TaxID=27915 RepID=A0AAD9NGS5_RIDPI|nr:hypothetical protein NP493_1304g00075 [Ridgeia piscesae]
MIIHAINSAGWPTMQHC